MVPCIVTIAGVQSLKMKNRGIKAVIKWKRDWHDRNISSWIGDNGSDNFPSVEKMAIESHYGLFHPVNIKNTGFYPTLEAAKKAAFMAGLSTDKIRSLREGDGFKQSYINTTL
jgi:hypothetical protein